MGRSTMTGRVLRALAVSGLALALLTAAPVAAHAAAETSAATTRSAHARIVRASGDFTVTLDVTSIALRPVGTRCLLPVNGPLEFSGTREGPPLPLPPLSRTPPARTS